MKLPYPIIIHHRLEPVLCRETSIPQINPLKNKKRTTDSHPWYAEINLIITIKSAL